MTESRTQESCSKSDRFQQPDRTIRTRPSCDVSPTVVSNQCHVQARPSVPLRCNQCPADSGNSGDRPQEDDLRGLGMSDSVVLEKPRRVRSSQKWCRQTQPTYCRWFLKKWGTSPKPEHRMFCQYLTLWVEQKELTLAWTPSRKPQLEILRRVPVCTPRPKPRVMGNLPCRQ